MPTQTTFSGFSQFAKDFWQGWKDTKDEAVDRFNKAVEIDEKQNLDQSVGDPDKVYAGQAPIVGLGGLASVALYPIGFAVNKVIPYADFHMQILAIRVHCYKKNFGLIQTINTWIIRTMSLEL